MRKITIKDLRKLAGQKGGKCLSDVYENSRIKLLWECSKGHQWQATAGNITHGKWCPICAGKSKLSIKQMQELAEKRSGKCLSDVYINSHTKLLWKCAKGHSWESSSNFVQQGHWCPYCAGKKKLTIEQMQELAEKRGGKCLSKVYKGSQLKLLWECSKGHQWQALPSNVVQGSWCFICARRESAYTTEQMQTIAKERGGKCLSEDYIDIKTKLLWKCSKGHLWEAIPISIIKGHWCPVCARNKKQTIEEFQELAAKRGGKCLSTVYERKNIKLLWECSEGHRWRALVDSVKRGTWCWQCYLDNRYGYRKRKAL